MAAELSPLRAWALRLHLRRCPECRREHASERLLWRDLSLLAASPASPSLRARTLASARAHKYLQGEEGERAPMFRLMLKRRFATALFAMVLLGAGAVLSGRLVPRWNASFQSGGHHWKYNANFAGRITLRDAGGQVISTWLSEGSMADEEIGLDLNVDGQRFLIEGTGVSSSNRLYGPNRELLGTVEMEHLTPDQVRTLEGQAGWSFGGRPYGSMSSDRAGASGFHKALGVTWQMRNAQAEVLMKDSQSRVLSTARIRASHLSLAQMGLPSGTVVPRAGAVPEFYIVVRGRDSTVRGFGVHPVRDAEGKTILLLEARPLKMAGG